MTKYYIVLIKWDILNKNKIRKKNCVHQKTVIKRNPIYIP